MCLRTTDWILSSYFYNTVSGPVVLWSYKWNSEWSTSSKSAQLQLLEVGICGHSSALSGSDSMERGPNYCLTWLIVVSEECIPTMVLGIFLRALLKTYRLSPRCVQRHFLKWEPKCKYTDLRTARVRHKNSSALIWRHPVIVQQKKEEGYTFCVCEESVCISIGFCQCVEKTSLATVILTRCNESISGFQKPMMLK